MSAYYVVIRNVVSDLTTCLKYTLFQVHSVSALCMSQCVTVWLCGSISIEYRYELRIALSNHYNHSCYVYSPYSTYVLVVCYVNSSW